MYEMNRQTNIKHIHVSTSELSIINRHLKLQKIFMLPLN